MKQLMPSWGLAVIVNEAKYEPRSKSDGVFYLRKTFLGTLPCLTQCKYFWPCRIPNSYLLLLQMLHALDKRIKVWCLRKILMLKFCLKSIFVISPSKLISSFNQSYLWSNNLWLSLIQNNCKISWQRKTWFTFTLYLITNYLVFCIK